MSLTYAIADLHGRFDLLTAAFDAIVKHAAERSFKIITLGDYVDRGPQSRQIIDHLMAAQEVERPWAKSTCSQRSEHNSDARSWGLADLPQGQPRRHDGRDA